MMEFAFEIPARPQKISEVFNVEVITRNPARFLSLVFRAKISDFACFLGPEIFVKFPDDDGTTKFDIPILDLNQAKLD